MRTGFTNFPATPAARRSQKALEAGYRPGSSNSQSSSRGLIERSQSALPSATTTDGRSIRYPVRATSLRESSTSPADDALPDPEVIYQHRDGGVVRELPPPYADRSARLSNPPESQN